MDTKSERARRWGVARKKRKSKSMTVSKAEMLIESAQVDAYQDSLIV